MIYPKKCLDKNCPKSGETDIVTSAAATVETITTICDDCKTILNQRTET